MFSVVPQQVKQQQFEKRSKQCCYLSLVCISVFLQGLCTPACFFSCYVLNADAFLLLVGRHTWVPRLWVSSKKTNFSKKKCLVLFDLAVLTLCSHFIIRLWERNNFDSLYLTSLLDNMAPHAIKTQIFFDTLCLCLALKVFCIMGTTLLPLGVI